MPMTVLNPCSCGRPARAVRGKGKLYIIRCSRRKPCVEQLEPKPLDEAARDWNKIMRKEDGNGN